MKLAQRSTRRIRRPRMTTFLPSLDITDAIVTVASGNRIPAHVVASSPVDIRMELDGNPAKGERVQLQLQLSDGSSLNATGIVHWAEMRNVFHEIGVFLETPLPDHMLDSMADVRRRTERYRVRIPGRLTAGSSCPECPATLVNYSFEGLAIRSEISGEIDDVFSFRWVSGDSARIAHGRILWQIEQNGGYLIGGEVGPGAGYEIAGIRRPNE